MKKFLLLLTCLFVTATIWAQAPQSMSYQAVVRDSNNDLLMNTQIGLKLSILQGSGAGTVVYTETQTPYTNNNGLISIEIGNGENFGNIDWSNGPYYIKTEMDPNGGTNYSITGTSQLLSVPYAFYAKTSENGFSNIIQGDSLVLKNSQGITRIVLNPNTGKFRMMNNDTAWYELQVASPPKTNQIVDNEGKTIKTYTNSEGETVKETIDNKTGITEISKTRSDLQTINGIEVGTVTSTTIVQKANEIISKNEVVDVQNALSYSRTETTTLFKEGKKTTETIKEESGGAALTNGVGKSSTKVKTYSGNETLTSIRYESGMAGSSGLLGGGETNVVEEKKIRIYDETTGKLINSEDFNSQGYRDGQSSKKETVTQYDDNGGKLNWEVTDYSYQYGAPKVTNTKSFINGALRKETIKEEGMLKTKTTEKIFNENGEQVSEKVIIDEFDQVTQKRISREENKNGGATVNKPIKEVTFSNEVISEVYRLVFPDETDGMNIIKNYTPGGVGGQQSVRFQSPANANTYQSEVKSPGKSSREFSNSNVKFLMEEYLGQINGNDALITTSKVIPANGSSWDYAKQYVTNDGSIENTMNNASNQKYGNEKWNASNASYTRSVNNPANPGISTSIVQTPNQTEFNGKVKFNGTVEMTQPVAETKTSKLTLENGSAKTEILTNDSYFSYNRNTEFKFAGMASGFSTKIYPKGSLGQGIDIAISTPDFTGSLFSVEKNPTENSSIFGINASELRVGYDTQTKFYGNVNVQGQLGVGYNGMNVQGKTILDETDITDLLKVTGQSVFSGPVSGNWTSLSFNQISVVPSPAGTPGKLIINGETDFKEDINAIGIKKFRIDHPTDNTKYLQHAAIESNEVLNAYSGKATTDGNGMATIILPSYFQHVNNLTTIRYQLSVISTSFVQAIVYEEYNVNSNSFKIKTSTPNTTVCWELKARRNDLYLQQHPFYDVIDK